MKNFDEQIKKIANDYGKNPIFDGVVSIEEYLKTDVKILWVLKEANSTGEDDTWDLRTAIAHLKTENGIKSGWEKTFRKIIYVVNGIINDTAWDDIPYTNDDPSIIDELKKIAYINVKKVGGLANANDNELYEFYNRSKNLLLEQIEAFNPDVIIFGGTYKFFKDDLKLDVLNKFGSCDAIKKDNRIYIDAYHPQYFSIREKVYFDDIILAYKTFSGNK